MAEQIINIGIADNDGTGDTLREASRKSRDNDTELYSIKEAVANKQNSLATDGTGEKYPTVDAVNAGLDGKVDDAQVLTNVPAGAVFTDTIYNDADVLKDADALTAVTPTNKLVTESDIASSSGATATHTQSVAATTWNFAHGTGNPYPVITVWNDLGKVIVPQDITMVDASNLTITFNVAVAGIATAVVGGVGVGNLTISTTPNGLSLTGQELALQLASATQIGALSSADWNTFNGKAPLDSPTFTTNITTPLVLGGTSTTQDLSFQTTSGVGATGADMHFKVGNNGATEAMTILNDGNVGIGTTSPSTKLYVDDGTGTGLTSTIASNNPSFGFYDKDSSYYAAVAVNNTEILFQKWSSPTTWVANPVKFSLNAPGASLVLASSGNVGIGTTSPTALLHLKAGTATAGTSPLKLTSGTLMTTPEAGAIEFLTDAYYATITTGAARKQFAFTGLAGVKTYYVSDTSGGATTRKLTFTDGILTAEI
jgi:hypothetical protein